MRLPLLCRPAFQHTAARRRLGLWTGCPICQKLFQHTAARRRLAMFTVMMICSTGVSTHSRPKAAGREKLQKWVICIVSTHSRPKAAGPIKSTAARSRGRFNTQPPEGGWSSPVVIFFSFAKFQHTAARRRLVVVAVGDGLAWHRFNTQPPEGGWLLHKQVI